MAVLRRWLILTIVLGGWAHAAGGQELRALVQEVIPTPPPAAFSLEDLIGLAQQVSPALATAAADVEAARGRAIQAGLYPNPTVQGGAMQLGGSESQYYTQLSQEIVTRHKLQLDQQAACRELWQAELKFVQARFELLTAVRQEYATALAAGQRLVVLEELMNLARKSHRSAVQFFEAGEGTKQDAILFEIEMDKAELVLENARVEELQARRRLAAVIGQRTLLIGLVTGNLAQPFPSLTEQVLLDDYVPRNASVQIAEIEVERARLLARRAEVQRIPNVTLNGGYMYQLQGVNSMGIVDLSFPLPLFDRNQGNILSARANISRAVQQVDQQQNEVARQMFDAVGRFRVADQQVARYEQRIIPRAREGVRLIQLGFETGQFDFQRLLQAQRSLVEADLNYVGALEARWKAAAELAGLAQVEAFP